MSGLKAYIAPFALFILLIGAVDPVKWLLAGHSSVLARSPEHIIYPLQTLLCALVLAFYWRRYELRWPRRIGITVAIAILVFAIWVSPQEVFGITPRREGFDPTIFENNRAVYATVIALRFVRLAIVVPLVEEIFWRGFLLRYFISEDFEKVPIGARSLLSFGAVTAGFMFEHSTLDWPAAICAGALFNLVAYSTKSLSSCVLAHAITNLLLGLYVMRTHQWGFW